ncbi:MAG: hypothetical protein AB1466_04900 [Actinomycetota bacterium]
MGEKAMGYLSTSKEAISKMVRERYFRVALVLVIILLILLYSWGIVYATFPKTFKLSPINKGIISTNRPRIHAKWSIFVGEKVEVVKALLDGRDVTDQVNLKPMVFLISPMLLWRKASIDSSSN